MGMCSLSFSSNPHFRETAVWDKTSRLFTISLLSHPITDYSQAAEIRGVLWTLLCYQPATKKSQIYNHIFNCYCFEDADVCRKGLGGKNPRTRNSGK